MGNATSAAEADDGVESDEPWEFSLGIPFESLTEVQPLAKGTTCCCKTAKLGRRDVAVKTLKAGESSKSDAEDLDRELHVLQLLHHPKIVRLAGAGTMPEKGVFLVTEYLAKGTLTSVLATDEPSGTSWMWKAHVRSWFPLKEALRQAAGVASALAYMHGEAMPGAKILHRDIKGTNMAFAADGTLKLFDFGLAKILRPRDLIGDNIYKMTGGTGSLRYMAPEVAQSLPSNETADVYSFAMVLWEMLFLELPFQFYGIENLMEQVVRGGVRPRMAPEWPGGLKDILTRCWSPVISERPSMAEVEKRLELLLRASVDL